MRQYVWEGACMLTNNRYQHISIDIHTQAGGGTFIHIVIGVEAGAIDMSCPTGQTGYDVERTQRGPLNHHREYPRSFPRCLQLSISREHLRGPLPDNNLPTSGTREKLLQHTRLLGSRHNGHSANETLWTEHHRWARHARVDRD